MSSMKKLFLFCCSLFAYLIREHINNNIGEIDDLLLVGAQCCAAQPCRAHVQRAHPAAADHRAMHCSPPHNNTLGPLALDPRHSRSMRLLHNKLSTVPHTF
ncbi:hypothetical protein B5X24_HaOG207705 [Helicoverpa armigera]|uniref:Secreted protein n=1 Tax=Helicoverpa armigera TaxID=29058 RepID=A0A2W1BI55_HELAM|nr:hypothetical protein B5X24_HaOG207705 [Helicoverpa armigera]